MTEPKLKDPQISFIVTHLKILSLLGNVGPSVAMAEFKSLGQVLRHKMFVTRDTLTSEHFNFQNTLNFRIFGTPLGYKSSEFVIFRKF